MANRTRKGVMAPWHLLGVALFLSGHLTAWSATPPFPSSTLPASSISLASRDSIAGANHPRWDKLSSAEREAIRDRRKQYESLPPAERQRIRDIHERYQELSPEERRELQERWRSQRDAAEARGRSPRTRD